jgi:hypothetical protein
MSTNCRPVWTTVKDGLASHLFIYPLTRLTCVVDIEVRFTPTVPTPICKAIRPPTAHLVKTPIHLLTSVGGTLVEGLESGLNLLCP